MNNRVTYCISAGECENYRERYIQHSCMFSKEQFDDMLKYVISNMLYVDSSVIVETFIELFGFEEMTVYGGAHYSHESDRCYSGIRQDLYEKSQKRAENYENMLKSMF